MKRKFLVVFLALLAVICLAFGLTACGESPESGNGGTEQGSKTPDEGQPPDEWQTPDEEQTPDDGGKEEEPTFEIVEGTAGLEYTLLDNGTYALTGLGSAKDEEEIVIADMYNGLPVTQIGLYDWLEEQMEIVVSDHSLFMEASCTSVIIPDGITTIGFLAFAGCEMLNNVVIPDSVTKICGGAFLYCISLESLVIPKSVTAIGSSAFSYCPFTSIELPNTITKLDDTFSFCDSLESIIIPDSVTEIGGFTFYGCDSLVNIVIPDSVTAIGDYAFAYCSFTSIVIPNSVTSIGASAFWNCSNLKTITIPDGVTSIGRKTFFDCISLESMVIPNSVTSIGDSAFGDCLSLKDIYYGGTVARWNNIQEDNYWISSGEYTVHCIDGDIHLSDD